MTKRIQDNKDDESDVPEYVNLNHSHPSIDSIERTKTMTKRIQDNKDDESDVPATFDANHIPQTSIQSVESESLVFDHIRQAVTYLRDKLRETPLESPEASAAMVFERLRTERLRTHATQEEIDHLFKLLLAKEANQAGLFPKKRKDVNALSENFSTGGYPYKHRYPLTSYENELYDLQVELLKFQEWVKRTGQKVIVIFEGRDAAGKGGTIRRFTENLNPRGARVVALTKPTEAEQGQWYFQRYVFEGRDAAGKGGTIRRFTENLNPRGARVVALTKPTEAEQGQWYFQRYVANLPNPGEIVFFDRSWYNRAVVEPVMGFCTQAQTNAFLSEVADFERSLIRGGTHIVKFWLSISQEEQQRRFRGRQENPLKRWKLSPVDIASMEKWDEYSIAIERMFHMSDTADTPWTVIRNEDKRRG